MWKQNFNFQVKSIKTLAIIAIFFAAGFFCLNQPIQAQTAAFTYQGSLVVNGAPANGTYYAEFTLWDALTGGNQIAHSPVTSLVCVNGTFTVKIVWANITPNQIPFPGADRFLQIRLGTVSFDLPNTLAPRQQINSSPYAIKSLDSDNALSLGGVAANQYLTTTSGNANYIQNSSSQQTANFNINGYANANIFDAALQYSLNGNRVLSATNNGGFGSLFAGVGTGIGGLSNAFFGFQVGQTNTGNANSFFGFQSGKVNTDGGDNSFFGSNAGEKNTTGLQNSFFGRSAGISNIGGNFNSFFGRSAGLNSTGNSNTFVGRNTGMSDISGSENTLLGALANVGANNLTNATAIGANTVVSQSNSLVLGNNANVGIGISAPVFKLQLIDSSNTGLRVQTNTAGGTVASFGGNGAFQIDAPGVPGGRFTVKENGNVGIGTNAPNTKLQVNGGSVYIANPNSLIITSPNGSCWFITVNNSGALSTISVTCP